MTDTSDPEVELVTAPTAPAAGEDKPRPGLNTDTLALAGVFISIFAFLAAMIAVAFASRAIDDHQAVADAIDGASSRGATAEVVVSLSEFAISPDAIKIPAGSVVGVDNAGTITHNLSVDGTASPMIAGGDSVELDLSSLEPGTYTMRCDVPGHEAAGMVGTLTIE